MSSLNRCLPLLALLLVPLLAAQEKEPNPNVRFGLPAPAGKEREAYLIERPQYVLSYNGKTCNPNWAVPAPQGDGQSVILDPGSSAA